MPRIRTIKPSFWGDESVCQLPMAARLLAIGLISLADDEGRFIATTAAIGGYVYPHDDMPARTVQRLLDAIQNTGLICIYTVDGRDYGHFPKWHKHQRINRPTPSTYPRPPQ